MPTQRLDMIVFAGLATLVAIVASLLTIVGNGMTTSAGVKGLGLIIASWFATLVLWLAWWIG